jgi:hypothetical protein
VTNQGATLTIPEAMAVLNVSDKTIRRLLNRGKLDRAGEIHGRILITAESVERVRGQVTRPQAAPDAPQQAPDAPSYAMVPVHLYERLQATHMVLAETVREQATVIATLQEQLREAQARPAPQPVQESPDTSLDRQTAAQGSAMRRLLRWWRR